MKLVIQNEKHEDISDIFATIDETRELKNEITLARAASQSTNDELIDYIEEVKTDLHLANNNTAKKILHIEESIKHLFEITNNIEQELIKLQSNQLTENNTFFTNLIAGITGGRGNKIKKSIVKIKRDG